MDATETAPRTVEDLRTRFGEAVEIAVKHRLAIIDEAAAQFIAQCPFLIIATSNAEGRCDASPKGDPPGFVEVADEHTLYIPDRAGNKIFRGIRNILENPQIGLLFLIPGEEWTLRINGHAKIVDEPATLARLSARGNPAQLAIEVKVEECGFHCPRSFKRAEVWNPERFRQYDGDSWGAIIAQRMQMDADKAAQLDAALAGVGKNL